MATQAPPTPGRAGGSSAAMQAAMAASSRPSLRKAFISLRHRDFRILFAGMLASNAAMGMQMLARGFLAFDLTGSFAIMGVISFSFAIPMFLFSLVGGATADRMDKRALMIITQIATGATALATAVMITTGVISIPLLFAVGVVQGTVMAFRQPVQISMLAEIVPEEELMSAMAINNAAMNATRPFAPMVAGLLLAAWGVDAVYYAQVAMYAVTLVFVLQLPRSTSHLIKAEERGGVVSEAAVGIRYVLSDRTLLLLLFMGFVPMMLMLPPMMTMLPGFAIAELGLGGDGLGYLMALGGIGSLFGSFAIAMLTEFPRKPLLQMGAGIGAGIGLLALGAGTKLFGLPGAVLALALLGLFQGPYMTLNMTMVLTRSRPEFIGRVMSVFMLLFGLMPFMSYPMGLLADQITASTTFALIGAALIGFMLMMFAINPKYTLSKVLPGGGDGDSVSGAAWSAFSGGGGGMGGGMSAGRGRSPMARPAPASTVATATAVQASDGAPGPAEPASSAPSDAPAEDPPGVPGPSRVRRSRRREYMADPVARSARDYMGTNGEGATGATGDGANGADGEEASGPVREQRAAAGYGLHRIRPPANGDGQASSRPRDGEGDATADATAEATVDTPTDGTADFPTDGSVDAPTIGTADAATDRTEHVELPPRRRAGRVERGAVAAVAASVVAGVLSSFIFRRPSNGR